MPTPEELSTDLSIEVAAELLNVSRAHLLELVASGAMSSHTRGAEQLVALVDVLAHRRLTDASSSQALDAMTIEAEDAGLYEW